jgi:hypothetical protein
MTTFTLTHGIPSTPRLALNGLWRSLRARFDGVAPAPAAAGPLGQAETAIFARGMLGWRG